MKMIGLHILLLALACGCLNAQDRILNVSVYPPPDFTGQWVAWYTNGQKKCECRYVQGNPDGKWVYWYDNGVKTTEIDYDKGQLNGHHTIWHTNGMQASQATFHKGEMTEPWVYWTTEGAFRHGTEITLYEDGQKKSEEHYVQGKRHGLLVYWNRNGKKQREEQYKNGLTDGVTRWWHDNGVMSWEIQFKDGRKHGQQVSWYPNGWKEDEYVFDKGRFVKRVPVPGDDAPKEWGIERAKDDLSKGIRRIYGYGMQSITDLPPRDAESGLPIEIVAGCTVSAGFPEKIQGYNETMRTAVKEDSPTNRWWRREPRATTVMLCLRRMKMGILASPIVFVPLLIAGLSLFGIARIKNGKVQERGHFVVSLIPWCQMGMAYSVAFYVRIGFGSWPRSCVDNPVLPMIDVLAPVVLLASILTLSVLPVLWIGWLVIRLRQGFRGLWVQSTVAFVSGIVLLLTLHACDPWGFWDWVLD